MSNVVAFPSRQRIPAASIPREEFERRAGPTLDIVDQIMQLLDAAEPDNESHPRETGDSRSRASARSRRARQFSARLPSGD